MTHKSVSVISGTVLDDDVELALDELVRACGAQREWVLELITEGIISPTDTARSEWRFQGATLARVRVARRLHRDLEVNLSGIALALDLLDEIEQLRSRLRQFDEPV